ncbi:hypothetical protein [Halobacillus karajensis]|uniref:hypothetical protein n=1 Tax=Halobacillus karajensis TaxID=195088 RepID=UPI001E3C2646|nr:hypothetical protein [Halobacillus karajensis]
MINVCSDSILGPFVFVFLTNGFTIASLCPLDDNIAIYASEGEAERAYYDTFGGIELIGFI